jgi:hypothetical protein
MKRSVFAAGVLAACFAAVSPAHADYAVVQFNSGFCKIWWDSGDNPWGPAWTKLAVGLPDHEAAEVALHDAFAQGACR